jgi:N-acetylmuramoyl-L-alanine amidase
MFWSGRDGPRGVGQALDAAPRSPPGAGRRLEHHLVPLLGVEPVRRQAQPIAQLPSASRRHPPDIPGSGGSLTSGAFVLALLLIGPLGCGGSTSERPAKSERPDEVRLGSERPQPRTDREGGISPPAIRQWRIPFGPRRREETAAYASRHYGVATTKLDPKVIVEHVSVTSTAEAVYATFSRDEPDPELHELPGVCSHFVVDRDGTVYQLAPLGLICRHTVGLNDVAIGVEHVGQADGDVLGDRAQLRASLRLSTWLRCRYGIRLRDVIGHAESLSSPYHHERVARLRTQTHSDFQPASMRTYRRLLARLAC